MQNTARRPKIMVSDDGRGIVSHGRALLLTERLIARLAADARSSWMSTPRW